MQTKKIGTLISVIITLIILVNTSFAQVKMNSPLFGVAYYDEYMPYDRLDKDVKMMQQTGITVVRIAESTWSTMGTPGRHLRFYAYRQGAQRYA
jgi:beta-galactosidase